MWWSSSGTRNSGERGGESKLSEYGHSFRSYLELTAGADGFTKNVQKWFQTRSKIDHKSIKNRYRIDGEIQEAKSNTPSSQKGVLVRQTLALMVCFWWSSGGTRSSGERGGRASSPSTGIHSGAIQNLRQGPTDLPENLEKWFEKGSTIDQKSITKGCQIDSAIQEARNAAPRC